MNVFISAPGGQEHFHLARSLYREGYLRKILTSKPLFTLKNHGLPEGKIFSIPVRYIIYLRNKIPILSKFLPHSFAAKLFDKIVAKYLGNADIFIGFPNWMLASAKRAKKQGIVVIAEGSSTHILNREGILAQEYKKFNVPFEPVDPVEKERQCEEYEIADYIFIPSEFVRRSFIKYGISESKLIKVPYGADDKFFNKSFKPQKHNHFRIVSTIGIRKGNPYLLEAVKKLKSERLEDIQLHLIGPFREDIRQIIEKYRDIVNFIGSIPHSSLLDYFNNADVFVQPSIEEGMSIMVLEAMASGLPVIVTPNTGTAEVIDNGIDGLVIPPFDWQNIYDNIKLLYENPEKKREIGYMARKKALNFTWEKYGERCIKEYKKILQKR